MLGQPTNTQATETPSPGRREVPLTVPRPPARLNRLQHPPGPGRHATEPAIGQGWSVRTRWSRPGIGEDG
jgi:hypothetical protein